MPECGLSFKDIYGFISYIQPRNWHRCSKLCRRVLSLWDPPGVLRSRWPLWHIAHNKLMVLHRLHLLQKKSYWLKYLVEWLFYYISSYLHDSDMICDDMESIAQRVRRQSKSLIKNRIVITFRYICILISKDLPCWFTFIHDQDNLCSCYNTNAGLHRYILF